MTLRHEIAARIPVRFCVGDVVDVLNASRLSRIEEVQHTGTVERISESGDLYWISGLAIARSVNVLRLVHRASRETFRETCPRCDGDGFGPLGGNCEVCNGSGKVSR